VLPGGAVSAYETLGRGYLIVDRGSGSHMFDIDGNEYVDYALGAGAMLLGHAHPAVVAAIQKQASLGTTFYATTPATLELAEEIITATPYADQVRFASSGTEATLYALRYAKAVTGRSKILKFAGGFHGVHDWVLMDAGAADAPFGSPLCAGLSPGARSEVLVVPYNDLDTCREVARRYQADLAAIIIEPLQRFIPPAPGFLSGLRSLTEQIGALLIFDEIITGFRLAYGGAGSYYGVTPDLTCYGKVMGGGLSVGAVCGPRSIMELSLKETAPKGRFVYHGGTFSGNPMIGAAGLATLRELRKPGTYERLHQIGARARAELKSVFQAFGVTAAVFGEGPLVGLVFGKDEIQRSGEDTPADRTRMTEFLAGLLEEGIFVRPSIGLFFISAVHTDADIDALLLAAERVLHKGRTSHGGAPAHEAVQRNVG
jgi:glutamate-1-semialdehyde 2,1-aminomutase